MEINIKIEGLSELVQAVKELTVAVTASMLNKPVSEPIRRSRKKVVAGMETEIVEAERTWEETFPKEEVIKGQVQFGDDVVTSTNPKIDAKLLSAFENGAKEDIKISKKITMDDVRKELVKLVDLDRSVEAKQILLDVAGVSNLSEANSMFYAEIIRRAGEAL